MDLKVSLRDGRGLMWQAGYTSGPRRFQYIRLLPRGTRIRAHVYPDRDQSEICLYHDIARGISSGDDGVLEREREKLKRIADRMIDHLRDSRSRNHERHVVERIIQDQLRQYVAYYQGSAVHYLE